MKFATATAPEALVNRSLRYISYGLGFWTVIIAIAQMVSFEEFVAALRGYHLTGERGTLALAILLLAVEIFSVPFFLRLPQSPAARWASALVAALTPYFWTALMIGGFVANADVQNAGYLGGFLAVPLGSGLVLTINLIWMTLVSISFGGLGGRRALRLGRKTK
jgi:hypothetical protein